MNDPASTPSDPKGIPFTPDQKAAHRFLTELRTRISTQPLPYQHGVEATALESLWKVFDHARDAIKENPGCEQFAARATLVLNRVVRPLTAKWHRAFEEGRLAGRDGADEFRGELQGVQKQLRQFAAELHQMAYGTQHTDELTPDVMPDAELEKLFHPLAFGFTPTQESPPHPACDQPLPRSERARGQGEGGLAGSRVQGANRDSVCTTIAAEENEAVKTRREKRAVKTAAGMDAIGLALSGGGIRSATFSLGVVQVLAEKGFLREVDFLSTVSGGGYTGSFLTQRLGNGEPVSDVAGPHGPDPEPVRYVRQHARFLSGDLKEKWSMVCATFAGMLLNWSAPVFVIAVLALVASMLDRSGVNVPWPVLLSLCGAASVMAIMLYGWGMRENQKISKLTGSVLGGMLALTGIVGLCWLLEASFGEPMGSIYINWTTSGRIGVVVGALAALAPGIIRFLPVLKEPKVRKLVLQGALWVAGLVVPLVVVVLFYLLRGLGSFGQQFSPSVSGAIPNWVVSHQGQIILVCAAVGCALVSIFVININLTGPHRLYRDSLARTFIRRTTTDALTVDLKAINTKGTAPYHLINAALNVPGTGDFALKDRGCDFFLFSRHWTGSPATGYHRTEAWHANGKPVDLATAMATSGAAASAHMGLGSMPSLTALLAVLNVRLGFWIKQPHTQGGNAPGFNCLLREMTGVAMSEKQPWLNLSDGGHIENLGVYELLRRRCKFIICVDGEADPAFTFGGLMTLVRHAQIDFGIRIKPVLDDLRSDPKTGYSKCHFHFCRIHYPEGVGLLLYLKLSVTGNEPELIRRYRITNPEFPHQSTLDQFFDQEQFEAYRQLGVHVAEGLFLPALMDRTSPDSVPTWFRQLAKNLLEPLPKV